VIETVFLDWALAFGTGVTFGLAGRREIASSPPGFGTRAFRWGLAYLHLGIIAVSVTAYAINPDWMWMYYVKARELPLIVVIMVFGLYEASFVAGFLLSPALERARRGGGFALAVVVGAGITIAEVASRARLSHFGTVDQFRNGIAPAGLRFDPLRIEPGMWVLMIAGPLSIVAVVALIVGLVRRARVETVTPGL